MTGSAAALLHVALQDLHAGKTAQAARLPTLAGHGRDPALVDLVREEADRAAAQGRRIAHAGVDVAGPECLWMRGILDDARRDTRRTQPGPLLDIALIGALIGALRKAKAAETVSSDTALALAGHVAACDLIAVVTANRRDEIDTDRRLKDRLVALAGPVG